MSKIKIAKQQTDGQLSLFNASDFSEETTPKPNESTPKKERLIHTYDHTALFQRLSQSDFRSRFHLHTKEVNYIREKGLNTIEQHATDLIAKRLAPAHPTNDGKQTPMKGHPVFIAQHATGCCCRGCLYKWHHIHPDHILTSTEQAYIVSVLMTWINNEFTASK